MSDDIKLFEIGLEVFEDVLANQQKSMNYFVTGRAKAAAAQRRLDQVKDRLE